MDTKRLSIIIKTNCDISAISSLMQQTNNSWECFIINNSVKNIEQYIIGNKQFIIVKDDNNSNVIYDTIQKAKGDYVLLINSNDILVPDAVDNILHMADFTDADIVRFHSGISYEPPTEISDKKCKFKYIFKKDTMLDYVFNNLSEFCFKKNIAQNYIKSEHVFLMNILMNAKDMATTRKTCIIQQQDCTINNNEYIDIVNNYTNNASKLSKKVWKKYFGIITSDLIKTTIKSNDKNTFIEFCKHVPLSLIPARYRIICYLFKKINK